MIDSSMELDDHRDSYKKPVSAKILGITGKHLTEEALILITEF